MRACVLRWGNWVTEPKRRYGKVEYWNTLTNIGSTYSRNSRNSNYLIFSFFFVFSFLIRAQYSNISLIIETYETIREIFRTIWKGKLENKVGAVWFPGGKMLAVFRRTSCQICAVKHSNEKCSAPSFSRSSSLQGQKEKRKTTKLGYHSHIIKGQPLCLPFYARRGISCFLFFLRGLVFFFVFFLREIYNFIFFKIITSISWKKVMHAGK